MTTDDLFCNLVQFGMAAEIGSVLALLISQLPLVVDLLAQATQTFECWPEELAASRCWDVTPYAVVVDAGFPLLRGSTWPHVGGLCQQFSDDGIDGPRHLSLHLSPPHHSIDYPGTD